MDDVGTDFGQLVTEYQEKTERNMTKVLEIMDKLATRGKDLEKELERTRRERDELAADVSQHYTRDQEVMIQRPPIDEPVLVQKN